MTEAASQLGVPIKLIVGPKMGHAFDPDSRNSSWSFISKNPPVESPGPANGNVFVLQPDHSVTTPVTG